MPTASTSGWPTYQPNLDPHCHARKKHFNLEGRRPLQIQSRYAVIETPKLAQPFHFTNIKLDERIITAI